MANHTLGYREVIPDHILSDQWKDIIINIGGSQSTLQDIKVPERAGGHCYNDSTQKMTCNRFIYWKIIHDVLELVEYSLDVHLVNNQLRYKFTNTPILDGISIHETNEFVVILVATVSSVHKFSFTHPNASHAREKISNPNLSSTIRSIFWEASIQTVIDPCTFYVMPTIGSTNFQVAHAGASTYISERNEALFTLAYRTGVIFLLSLNSLSGSVQTIELKQDSYVPRFLSGIATALRGRVKDADIAASLINHAHGNKIYILAFCKEGHLRMWSCNKALNFSMTDVIFNNCNDSIQNHLLRKYVSPDGDFFVCTYIKFDFKCVFMIYKITLNSRIVKQAKIISPLSFDQHLVDFTFSKTGLWAVWRTSDIDTTSVKYIGLPSEAQNLEYNWESVVLVKTSTKEYTINDFGIEPRQAYTDQIFRPGQFSKMDIIRALNIFRKSSYVLETTLSLRMLKIQVCAAVEAEVQAESGDYELMDEDYLEIVNRCWSRFYSCVLQYHINRLWPVGLLLLQNSLGIILIKKSFISIIRPMDVIEHLVLCNETLKFEKLNSLSIPLLKEVLSRDVIDFMAALNIIDEYLPENFNSNFEKELFYLESPDNIICNMLDIKSFAKSDFQTKLCTKLENVKDVCGTLALVIEFLTSNLIQISELCPSNKLEKSDLNDATGSFGSQLGIEIISETVTQIVLLRFNTSKNLLILLHIANKFNIIFNFNSMQTIKSTLAQKLVDLIKSYYVVKWVCQINAATSSLSKHSKMGLQRLHSLKIPKEEHTEQYKGAMSILSLFIKQCMKPNIYKHLDEFRLGSISSIKTHSYLLSHSFLFVQCIFPVSDSFFFPMWLLSTCEFFLVQEYVRLLSVWCKWNSGLRYFISAISFLETGEPQKAYDFFVRASNVVIPDSFSFNVIFDLNTEENILVIQYFLKVIEIFENYTASDFIIELVEVALNIINNISSYSPTLYSIIFVEHLNLQHYVESYNVLNANPDAARRIDCLRQLIVALFQHKNIMKLVSFPYVNMYKHLEDIVEARARSGDLMENNYYDFLYCFHINKGNFRKGASIVYEQAIRYSQENCSLITIAQQIQCLCICLNAINLINRKYQWIILPCRDMHRENTLGVETDKLHKNQILHHKIESYMEILDSKDIKKQYLLAEAKHKILKNDIFDYSSWQISSSEIVVIMSNIGYYTDSLKICEYFNLDKTTVLDNATAQCVKYTQNKIPFKCNWIFENKISDLNVTVKNKTNIFWKLLEQLVLKHEIRHKTDLHKIVASKIFYFGALLPNWLILSYKKQNMTQLIRLTMQMGRLEEATSLCIEYITAVLGKAPEYFGLDSPLLATGSSVLLPLNIIEILLLELELYTFSDRSYTVLYKSLLKVYENYSKIVVRVSFGMLRLKCC